MCASWRTCEQFFLENQRRVRWLFSCPQSCLFAPRIPSKDSRGVPSARKMLISCKCLNITEFNNSVDDQVLKRNGAVQSLLEIVPGPDEIQGLGGLAGFYYIYREFVKSVSRAVSQLQHYLPNPWLAFSLVSTKQKRAGCRLCIASGTKTTAASPIPSPWRKLVNECLERAQQLGAD